MLKVVENRRDNFIDLMKEMILDFQGFWGEFHDQQGDMLMIDSIVRLVTLLCPFVGRKFPSVDLASRSNPGLLGKRTFEVRALRPRPR